MVSSVNHKDCPLCGQQHEFLSGRCSLRKVKDSWGLKSYIFRMIPSQQLDDDFRATQFAHALYLLKNAIGHSYVQVIPLEVDSQGKISNYIILDMSLQRET